MKEQMGKNFKVLLFTMITVKSRIKIFLPKNHTFKANQENGPMNQKGSKHLS